MSRKLMMTIHLYLAAFFAPILLLMAVSGGLYLVGVKGSMDKGDPVFVNGATIDAEGDTKAQIKTLLDEAGFSSRFESVKDRGDKFQTRPSSRDHFEITPNEAGVSITPVSPSLVAAMMELHMGHGPKLYRSVEIVMALGLVLILLSGLIIGIKSPLLKTPTVAVSAAGIIIFIVLAALL